MKKSSRKQSRKEAKKSSRKISKKSSRKESRKMSPKTGAGWEKKGGSKLLKASNEHNEEVIKKYMEKIDSKIKENKLESFWIFPETGFTKKYRKTFTEIEKMTKKSPEKYSGKTILDIKLMTLHNDYESIPGKKGAWLVVDISAFPIGEKGELLNREGWGIGIQWKEEDFKIGKFTFKMLEHLADIMYKKKLEITGSFGMRFKSFLKELKSEKINIDSYLTPLEELE